MTKKNKRLVVVLGMHRSGTSVVTRCLKTMGVDLGEQLLVPIKGVNDKGFWEDRELYFLNVEMLEQFNREWFHLATIAPADVKVLHQKGYFLRAVDLLRKKTEETPIFGFKDPRVAKLLPFWKAVFEHLQLEVNYILVIRHPLSVAKSLARRDRFPEEQSHLIWLGHVLPSLIESHDAKLTLVNYDNLMRSPEYEVSRIAKSLHLEVNSSELESYVKEFLSKELRHSIYNVNDLLFDKAVPALIREVHFALCDVATDKAKIADVLEQKQALWVSEFDRLAPIMTLLDKVITESRVKTVVLDEHNKLLEDFKQKLEGQEKNILQLKQDIRESDSQLAVLNQGITERDAQIAELKQGVSIISEDLGVQINNNAWVITQPSAFYYQGLLNRPKEFIRRKLKRYASKK